MDTRLSIRETYIAYMKGEATWQDVLDRTEDFAAAYHHRPRRTQPSGAPEATTQPSA